MATFSEMKYGLDEIARKTNRARDFVFAARKELTRAQSDLGAMLADYNGLVAEINAVATNNPEDAIYQHVKLEKDKLVADFQELKTYVDDLITAFDGVSE